ncbi:SPJ_0845 family protein [Enterococcus alcedinis]
MGLKFQREDSLDKMFEEFAILPEVLDDRAEKHAKDIERFLTPQTKETKKEEQKKKISPERRNTCPSGDIF